MAVADTVVAATLAERVANHMTVVFPTTVDAGAWQVARDSRDGTVVVVWRAGYEPVQPQVRGMLLYRWLCSLRDAGFTAQARLDLAPFGRPDEVSRDGIARWLHVTGWAWPGVAVSEPLPPLPPKPRRSTVPLPKGHGLRCPLSGIIPVEAQFTYRADAVEVVLIYELPEWSWGQLETRPAAWLLDLAEQHRPLAAPGGERG
jgi:hypothetical protein